jgi:hypothetical protein
LKNRQEQDLDLFLREYLIEIKDAYLATDEGMHKKESYIYSTSIYEERQGFVGKLFYHP